MKLNELELTIYVFYKQSSDMVYCLILQEGQRPCQIISPQLEVGGHLQRNASNGKTEVTINGREITKKELWILKVVVDLGTFIVYNFETVKLKCHFV